MYWKVHLVYGKCTPFFFLYDKLRTYSAFAVWNRYVLPEYKNVKNVQIRIKFEFENFSLDKTVLWKTYVTYGENAKEHKSTYWKRIFFIRNCALFYKTYLSFRTFFTDKLWCLWYGIGTFFPNIKTYTKHIISVFQKLILILAKLIVLANLNEIQSRWKSG